MQSSICDFSLLFDSNRPWNFFTGLDKLASAEVEVKHMQQLLKDMKPKLEQAAEATARMIERITLDTVSILFYRSWSKAE